MSEDVKEAIYNLQRFGVPVSDPVTKTDIQILIMRIVDLAKALSNEKSN